jgi:MFS family permease
LNEIHRGSLTTLKNLGGNKYAWVASIFYIGYFIWEYPATILIQKLPVGRYVGMNILAWGLMVGATSACTKFGQLLTARIITGALESTISPSFLYIISMWYSRDEIPSRMGVWYAGNSCGGAVANLLSWAVGHIEHSLSPWRWMYIVGLYLARENFY